MCASARLEKLREGTGGVADLSKRLNTADKIIALGVTAVVDTVWPKEFGNSLMKSYCPEKTKIYPLMFCLRTRCCRFHLFKKNEMSKTIGMLIESMAGKSGALHGTFQVCAPSRTR